MSRKIVKKRVGPDGVEIDCEEDNAPWVDIKETTKAKYERGRGRRYQKTIYTHVYDTERRAYEDEPKITFVNPDDGSQSIEYLKTKGPNHGIIKTFWIEAGRGAKYQKTKVTFYNADDNNSRKVREQRVENDETGDYIMVERIENWTNEWGKGPRYQKKKIHLNNTEEDLDSYDGPCKGEEE